MSSFVFSENTDQYKTLVWRQFYHSQKQEFFLRKRLRTVFFLVMPILLLLAYSANGNTNNLVGALLFLLVVVFWIAIFFARRNAVKKSIADFANSHPYTVALDENAITYITTESHTEIKWSYFLEYEEFENNFTLYPHEKFRQPTYLPLSFASDGEDLAALVRQKVKKRQE